MKGGYVTMGVEVDELRARVACTHNEYQPGHPLEVAIWVDFRSRSADSASACLSIADARWLLEQLPALIAHAEAAPSRPERGSSLHVVEQLRSSERGSK